MPELAAGSPTDAWAVGEWFDPMFNPHPLVNRWDGKRWRMVPTPELGMGSALAVDAIRDVNTVKEHIRSTLSRAINQRTKRRPVIIPVVMEV